MGTGDMVDQERLLRALAEQLKSPLMRIARSAELCRLTDAAPDLRDIEYTADVTLRLIDSYLLSVHLQALPSLNLEPVSVQAVMQDTAHRLSRLADQYNCDVQVHATGHHGLVMGHRQGLESAMMSLGYAFIESVPASDARHTVVLGVHGSAQGLVAGVFGEQPVTGDSLRRARALYGRALQSFPKSLAANGAGVFVADALLRSMQAPLRSARHQRLSGLATTLLPSNQLQLV